jgi:basic amino acid/polyamine antiporter, APA family
MRQTLGLWHATSLVVGNMVGAGIFLLPASLAAFGSVGLLGWIVTACGAICLALVFARLGRHYPETGGPYAYSRRALGDFMGFQVAWNYWIANGITGNAALAVGFVSYATYFIPELAENWLFSLGTGLSALWLLTFINALGIRAGGTVQLVITILKVIPLIIMATVGLFHVNWDHIFPLTTGSFTFNEALTGAVSLTLFAFIGLEASTIPAENVEDAKKTIPRATIIGTVFAALIYIVTTIALMGIIPPMELAQSQAPFADAAYRIFGVWWIGAALAASAVLSSFGTLNGWILLQGQIPYAVARDGLFPKIFTRLSKSGVPIVGLLVSSILTSFLLIRYSDAGLVKQFTFIGQLTIFSTLIPYLYTALSDLVLLALGKEKLSPTQLIRSLFIALIAFSYSVWAIAGSGQDIVFFGTIFTLASLPLYAWVQKYKAIKKSD